MREQEHGTTFATNLGLNLSSALGNIRWQQVGDDDLALLRSTLCQNDQLQQQQQQLQQQQQNFYSSSSQLLTSQQEIYNYNYNSNARPLTKLLYEHLYEPTKMADKLIDYYFTDFWSKNGDPRSSKLPFMSAGPWKLIYATIIYLYLIKWLLPQAMRHRKAFELNWCIRFYNLLMVLSNLYAFYHGSRILLFGTRCFGCEIIDPQDKASETMELLHYGWLFLLSRLIEWLDTVFFVLRKKERQVSKLHVFHHSFVPMFCWVYLKFLPGYTVAFFPYVNSFVHTIMYSYYFLATFGPKIQPYLWWKRHLTSMQIIQFVLILIQLASIPLSTNEQCQYPRGFLLVAFAGAILFLWLFYTYYMETYNINQKKSSSKQNGQQEDRSKIKKQSQQHLISNGNNRSLYFSREGSSRSLEETIENVLENEPLETQVNSRPTTTTTSTSHIKRRLHAM